MAVEPSSVVQQIIYRYVYSFIHISVLPFPPPLDLALLSNAGPPLVRVRCLHSRRKHPQQRMCICIGNRHGCLPVSDGGIRC